MMTHYFIILLCTWTNVAFYLQNIYRNYWAPDVTWCQDLPTAWGLDRLLSSSIRCWNAIADGDFVVARAIEKKMERWVSILTMMDGEWWEYGRRVLMRSGWRPCVGFVPAGSLRGGGLWPHRVVCTSDSPVFWLVLLFGV